MGRRTIPVGGFCYEELQSPAVDVAVPFYGALAGWAKRRWVMPDGTVYTLFGPEGEYLAGAQPHSPAETGKQTGWLSYVRVADVDRTAQDALELGGTVLCPPHDVPGVGRAATVADPEGIPLAVMRFNEPTLEPDQPLGSFIWRELQSADPGQAASFYKALLDWSSRELDMGPHGAYTLFTVDDRPVAGLMALCAPEAEARWTPYLAVASAADASRRAAEAGGVVLVPPTEVPGVGFFALVRDPAGDVVGLLEERG